MDVNEREMDMVIVLSGFRVEVKILGCEFSSGHHGPDAKIDWPRVAIDE
jgi:hypothetical protein